MKDYKNYCKLSEDFFAWLKDGKRKFVASSMGKTYCFVKEDILNNATRVYQLKDMWNPQKKIFVGFYFRYHRCFYFMETDFSKEILIAIPNMDFETIKDSLYQELFSLMKQDAKEVALTLDNPFANEKIPIRKLTEIYIAGEKPDVTCRSFKNNILIEDMDVVDYLQGKRVDVIYSEMGEDPVFDEVFNSLVENLQEAFHLQNVFETFQPTENLKVQKAILGEVRRNHLNNLPIRITLKCEREDINENFRQNLPESFLIHGEVIAGWIFVKPCLLGDDFRARFTKGFWRLDNEGRPFPVFDKLPWSKITEAKFVDKNENCLALYWKV